MNGVSILALIAVAPLAIGPLPNEERSLTMSLCDGGEITIPIGDEEPEGGRHCDLEACHAGTCRQKFKQRN